MKQKKYKKPKRKIQTNQMKKILKKNKIRECCVKLPRLTLQNSVYLQALFEKHCIRNCFVKLRRLKEEEIHKELHKELPKLHRLEPIGTVRRNSNISWFPGGVAIRKNSVDARASLAVYQNQNGVVIVGKKKSKANGEPTKRQRVKSMLDERFQPAIVTNRDRSQKTSKEHQLPVPLTKKQSSAFQRIHEECKAKLLEKNAINLI